MFQKPSPETPLNGHDAPSGVLATNGESNLWLPPTGAPLPNPIETAAAPSDIQELVQTPEGKAMEVPRPSFALFEAQATEHDVPKNAAGEFVVGPQHSNLLVPGQRGFAMFAVNTESGRKTVIGPAIVLPNTAEGGIPQVAVLTAEAQPDGRSGPRTIYDHQHVLLDTEYLKAQTTLTAEHKNHDLPDVTEIGASLMVASSLDTAKIHGDSHVLAEGQFGPNFANDGRQDMVFGHTTRSLRSEIVIATRVVFETAEHFQLPPDYQHLDLNLSPQELAVGMALAATQTRNGKSPDLVRNMGDILNV